MLIKTITGVTDAVVTFRKNVSGIQLIMAKVGGVNYFAPMVLAFINSATKTKRVTFTEKIPCWDMAEFAAVYRDRRIKLIGQLVLTTDTTAGVAAARPVQCAPIIERATLQLDFTDGDNGVQLSADEDIVLEFSGLDAGATYEIHSNEEPSYTERIVDGHKSDLDYLKYDILATKMERNMKFENLQGITRFAVENAAGFESIEVGHIDGSNVKYSPDDLLLAMADSFGNVVEFRYSIPKVGGGFGTLSDFIDTTVRNFVLPIDETVSYVQVNVAEVAGVVPSLRVLTLREEPLK